MRKPPLTSHIFSNLIQTVVLFYNILAIFVQ